MQEIIKLLIGVLVLLLGFPIGTFLARTTKEELKQGRQAYIIYPVILPIGCKLAFKLLFYYFINRLF